MTGKEQDWSRPAAMAIPKEGYFELDRGRYGPIYPRTPACYGFSIIAKVKESTGTEPTVVWLLNKSTNKVEEFPIANGKITVKPVNNYFTASVLSFGYKTVVSPSSSSGGGCNAGFAPAMLLLALPLALFIRK